VEKVVNKFLVIMVPIAIFSFLVQKHFVRILTVCLCVLSLTDATERSNTESLGLGCISDIIP
jgi:hypothetical protein